MRGPSAPPRPSPPVPLRNRGPSVMHNYAQSGLEIGGEEGEEGEGEGGVGKWEAEEEEGRCSGTSVVGRETCPGTESWNWNLIPSQTRSRW